MIARQILALTLLASSLTLNAAVTRVVVQTKRIQTNSITASIANKLFNRGIEKNKALQISQNFIGENEELFTLMVHNYGHSLKISHDTIYSELSKLALARKKADFTSYDFLVKFTHSVHKTKISKDDLNKLASISTNNRQLHKVFV